MKWLEKNFVLKKEMVKIVGPLGPKRRSAEELAEVVYRVRRFHKGAKAVKPTKRAVHGGMFRSLRVLRVTMGKDEREAGDGRKKPVIVYINNPVT